MRSPALRGPSVTSTLIDRTIVPARLITSKTIVATASHRAPQSNLGAVPVFSSELYRTRSSGAQFVADRAGFDPNWGSRKAPPCEVSFEI